MPPLKLAAACMALSLCGVCMAQTSQPTTVPATQPNVAPASTQPAAPAAAPSADAILARLSGDRWQARQAAQDELVRMGEDARPIIGELLKRAGLDADVRTHLEAALAQIDENRLTGPSFVTLHLKDVDAKTAFAELSKQCYADLKPFPDNLFDQGLPRVSIDVDRVPFWTAMKPIAEKTGVDLQQYNYGIRLMRGGFRMNSPWSTVQGPFLIVATQLNRSQTVMLANGGAGANDFALHLTAYSEPKLHVLSSSASVKLDEATDDAGNSLLPNGPDRHGYYGGGGGCWNLYAQLRYPDKPGEKIASVRGTASFTVQTKSERIEIGDLKNAKEVARVIGGMPVVIHELKPNNGNWELRLSATTTPNGNAWGQLHQSVQTRLQLLDAQGQQLDHRGMGSRGEQNSIEFTLTFASSVRPSDGRSSGEPTTLVWDVPTASKQVSVPFEFKGLPMPK